MILSAVYMLWMFQRVNYGAVTNEKNRALPDLTPREWALMVPDDRDGDRDGRRCPDVFLRPMEPSVARRRRARHGSQAGARLEHDPAHGPTTAPAAALGADRLPPAAPGTRRGRVDHE